MSSNPFLEVQQDIDQAERSKVAHKHPTGWEPRLVVEGDTANLVSRPVPSDEPAPGWEDELRERGGDPTRWRPSGPVRFSSWDAQVKGGEIVQMHAYRWNLVPVGGPTASDVDLDATIKRIRKHRKQRPQIEGRPQRAFVVALADWQAGKRDGGGIEALIERVESLRDAVPDRIRQLRKGGVDIDALYVVSLGDLVEGCGDHYPMQTWSVELDGRAQERAVRRLLVELITAWSSLAPQVVVAAVPGNHGERRRDGKAYTTFEDNVDLAVVEQVGEILAQNPDAYGHVRVALADGDMTLVLDVAGTVIGFAHGHQARGGATPQAKLRNFWRDKAQARHRLADADVLVSGHYHHLQIVQDGPRTWMQAPANDGGSRWFEETGGATTVSGTLTFTSDETGWANVEVVR